ncbi:MAG: hypothetical protein IJS15_15725 [Victivallales bacterium]|nr:hypothetical protein [Victivallales bacterium]
MPKKNNDNGKKKGGCLKKLIIALVVLLVLALLGLAGAYFGTKIALAKIKDNYTADQPDFIEREQLNSSQRAKIRRKYTSIKEVLRTGKKTTIELEGKELSQIIGNAPETEKYADAADFWIEGDRLWAKMSIPMDALPQNKLPKMFTTFFRGRFLNGVFKLDFSIKDGNLKVNVEECLIKGNPVNETILQMINSQHFDTVIGRRLGPAWREYIESLEIRDNKMIIKTK